MDTRTDREVSIIDAARIIYRTRAPNDGQIHRVYALMKSGALRPYANAGPPLKWTTTELSLADFLAAHRVVHAKSQHAQHEQAQRPSNLAHEKPAGRLTDDDAKTEMLLGVYRGIWRDYFRAVLLRRRIANSSKTFDRAVVAGQVGVLLAIVTTVILSVRWAVVSTPPEHLAVVRWLDDNTDEHDVTQWYPIEPAHDGAGVTVRVAYRYTKESRRWVHTDRTFRVVDDQAVELTDENP